VTFLPVSVVVATRDRPQGVRRLLSSLGEQRLDSSLYEVIVVDDGSRISVGESCDADRAGAPVRIFHHESSRGPAAARNTGWRAARGELVAFTDDDCHADPAWLEALLDAWAGQEDVVVQGRTRPDPDWSGPVPPLGYTMDVAGPDGLYETCNIAYPRRLLERVGGFDESYRRPCGEDLDLGMRAVSAGARLIFAGDAVVFHDVRSPGLRGSIRRAWMWRDAVRVLADYPQLRKILYARVFWKRSHALLVAALAGSAAVTASRRAAPAAAAAPYLASLTSGHGRWRRGLRSLRWAPAQLAVDLAELAAMVAGSAKQRILML